MNDLPTCVYAVKTKTASPLTLNPVANGDSLPFVGPEPHSVAPLKPQSLRGEGTWGREAKKQKNENNMKRTVLTMLAEADDDTPAEQKACSMLCDEIPYELLASGR